MGKWGVFKMYFVQKVPKYGPRRTFEKWPKASKSPPETRILNTLLAAILAHFGQKRHHYMRDDGKNVFDFLETKF